MNDGKWHLFWYMPGIGIQHWTGEGIHGFRDRVKFAYKMREADQNVLVFSPLIVGECAASLEQLAKASTVREFMLWR